MPTTVRKVITTALRNLGVTSANSAPTDEDVDICMMAFNSMIDSLSNNILNVFKINPYRFPMEEGKNTYTLGPAVDEAGQPTGADWVIPRPMRIEQAVLMVYAPTDGDVIGENSSTLFLALDTLNYAQYASITVRRLQTTWPTSVYDNGGYPVRTLTFWPVPQMTLACELWLWEPLATYDSLNEELNLPPGYERYLTLKLAKEVCPEFGAVWTDTLEARMREAENAVQVLNQMPAVSQPTNNGRAVTVRSPSYVSNDGKGQRIPRVN